MVPDSVSQSIDQSFAAAKWLPVGITSVPGGEPSHRMSNGLNSDINPNSNQGCFISTVERSNTSPGGYCTFSSIKSCQTSETCASLMEYDL